MCIFLEFIDFFKLSSYVVKKVKKIASKSAGKSSKSAGTNQIHIYFSIIYIILYILWEAPSQERHLLASVSKQILVQ